MVLYYVISDMIENKMEPKFKIDPLTGFKILEWPSQPPMGAMQKEEIKRIQQKVLALQKPCVCGNEMKFEAFNLAKSKSVSFTGENITNYIGKFQCPKCGKRYYITREQIEK